LRTTLRSLSPARRSRLLAGLSADEWVALDRDWAGTMARDAQLAPAGAWSTWLILAGRGWGKTRTGAEWIRSRIEAGARRIALVGATAADVRDVMVEGPSGVLATAAPRSRPRYVASTRSVTWPNGAVALTFSAEEPDRLRGPEHDTLWADELAAWKYPEDAWHNALMGLRVGDPRACVTTTPRPIKLVRELLADPSTRVTRGSTYANAANLAPRFLAEVRRRYEGTRLGRQELHAELLEDTPGALWTRAMCEAAFARVAPDLRRVLVAVDPSVAADGGGDEAGIVVVAEGADGLFYVIADRSDHLSPDAWARRTIAAHDAHAADAIVAEANNGGELVRVTLRAAVAALRAEPVDPRRGPEPAVRLVHASRGKRARAEPIAALYEQGRVRHVGALPRLEDELCAWASASGDPSPNRLDALVWGLSELALPPRVDSARPRMVGSTRGTEW
jgi:phage terminase large subunit-like protein